MTKDQSAAKAAEPDEECGWCRFMKAGPCRKVFEGWQACVDGVKELMEGEGGNHAVVEQCADVTAPLFECMAKHRYYYASQLEGMASRSTDQEQQPQPAPAPAEQPAQSSSSSSNQGYVVQQAAGGSIAGGSSNSGPVPGQQQRTAPGQTAGTAGLATM